MPITSDVITVNDAFFGPIVGVGEASKHAYLWPVLSDRGWVPLGIHRVLEEVPSGRGFLQGHAARFELSIKVSNYFSSLQSSRRGAVLEDVFLAVVRSVQVSGMGRLDQLPELTEYLCFAVDIQWHKPEARDDRYDGRRASVGHTFSLNLHDHSLRHLVAADGEHEHEHDMTVMDRLKLKGLHQGAPKGKRVVVVYVRAGGRFGFWARCRHENAVCFLSRTKSNMRLEWADRRPWDPADRREHSVLYDQWAQSGEGHRLWLIEYRDPETWGQFRNLSNEPDLPPGVLDELYRRRWEVRNVFAQVTNKLGEKKAWAISSDAWAVQARFMALTSNLLLLYERRLEREHGVTNESEERRREKRGSWAERTSRATGRTISMVPLRARDTTQRSVKLIHWLCGALQRRLMETATVPLRKQLYATQ